MSRHVYPFTHVFSIPSFEQDVYQFEVDSTLEKGGTVGEVLAYDQDALAPNNKLIYGLNNTDGMENFFEIDQHRGVIRTKKALAELAGKRITVSPKFCLPVPEFLTKSQFVS